MVGRPVAQHRGRLPGERGVDDLAGRALRPGDLVAGGGVDQLDGDAPLAAEVHAVLVVALAPYRREDVGQAHDFPHVVEGPTGPDLLPDLGLAEAGLAAAEELAHPEGGGGDPDQVLAVVGQVGAERGGGEDGADLQPGK